MFIEAIFNFKQHISPSFPLKSARFLIRAGCPHSPTVQLLKVEAPMEVKGGTCHQPRQPARDEHHSQSTLCSILKQ